MSRIICISYFPTSQLLSMFDLKHMSAEEIIENLKNMQLSLPTSCAWVNVNDRISPILIINNAETIFENTKAWSENEPSKWFYFGLKTNSIAYSIGLFPNLDASLERFKNHQIMLNRQVIKDHDKIEIVYHPLEFTSGIDTVNKIKNKIIDSIDVGFAESIDDINNDKIYWLNNISIGNDKISYIDTYLETSLQSTLD